MKLELIHDLNESSQYRTRSAVKGVSARRLADHAFIDMLTLWILYNEFDSAPIAIKYAAKTLMHGDFRRYSQAGTDLYMTLHFLTNKNADAIAGDGADQVLLDRIDIKVPKIKHVLSLMRRNALTPPIMRPFLQEFERKLFITDNSLRSARRLAQGWPTLNEQQRALVITRLLQFYRLNARRSELFGFLQDLARTRRLGGSSSGTEKTPKSRTNSTMANAAIIGASGYAGYKAGRALGDWLSN